MKRRRRELLDLAVAYHSPEKIDEMYPPQVTEQAARQNNRMETERWW